MLPANTGMQGESNSQGAAGLAWVHWADVTKHQGLKDSQAGRVSSMLQGSHTRVALPSTITAAAVSPGAALLLWYTSTTAACSGQGHLVPPYSLHTLQSLSRQAGEWEAPWHVWTEPPDVMGAQHEGKHVVQAGDVNQEETVPVKILIPASLALQERERGHGGGWHMRFNLIC